jgi:hypothetical protein
MALAAVNHLFFQSREGIGERFYVRFGLTQQMQHEPQRRPPPHSGQRSHLVNGLL